MFSFHGLFVFLVLYIPTLYFISFIVYVSADQFPLVKAEFHEGNFIKTIEVCNKII